MTTLHLSAPLIRWHTPSNSLFQSAEGRVILTLLALFKAASPAQEKYHTFYTTTSFGNFNLLVAFKIKILLRKQMNR